MLTVKQYATSRGISESTAKNWITRLDLELIANPADKRQRLISTSQAAQLDQAFNVRSNDAPAAAAAEITVIPYERSSELSMTIAEASLTPIDYSYQRPEDNPLLQHLQHQVAALAAQNAQALSQVTASTQAQQDAVAALDAIHRLRIVQAAQAEAIRDFHLKQQIYAQQTTNLELAAAGIAPPPMAPLPSGVPISIEG
jgi:transposase